MFNVDCHLKGELGTLCNVPANWARSVSDIFLSESILTCLPFFKKIVKCIRKKLKCFLLMY